MHKHIRLSSARTSDARDASGQRSPSQTRPPPAESDRNRMEGDCVHRTPVPVTQRTPFPHRTAVPKRARNISSATSQTYEKQCSATSIENINIVTSQKYVVQHQKTCTATSKNM